MVTYDEWLALPEVQDATEEVVNGEIRSPYELAQKVEHYAAIGVPEAWLLRPDDRTVEVLLLEDGSFRRSQLLVTGNLQPKVLPRVHIDIDKIWLD